MTTERGDSPLAGRRPAPLNNVHGINAISMTTSTSLSSLHAPNTASTLQAMPLPPLGGLSVGHSSTAFWRELKDVELWFDSLDSQERVALIASLAARSQEQQLHQYSSTIEKALRNQNSANLSRLGVGQEPSVYRYRSPLSAGAARLNTSSLSSPSSSASGPNQPQPQGPATAPSSATASATAPNSAKSYSHAFLPLGFSPWGTEIRRPNSATADAWPDTSRGSPTVQNVEPDGSPIGLKPWRTFTPQQPIGSQPQDRAPLYPYRLYANKEQNSAPGAPLSEINGIGSSVGGAGAGAGGTGAGGTGPSATGSSGAGSSGAGSSGAGSSGAGSGAGGSSAGGSSAGGPSGGPSGSNGTGASGPNGTGATTFTSTTSTSTTGSPAKTDAKTDSRTRRNVNVIDVELLSDIGAWLRSLRLHKYTGNLSGMQWQEVILLRDEDLEARGVNALGARRKLLKMFEEIRQAQDEGLLVE